MRIIYTIIESVALRYQSAEIDAHARKQTIILIGAFIVEIKREQTSETSALRLNQIIDAHVPHILYTLLIKAV